MSDRHTVLVVEDEVFNRMAGVDIVEEAGFDALAATSAHEALLILKERPDIELVFTDVDMPGSMDGRKFAHYVHDRWPAIRLIVASGKAIVAERDLPAGAKFFSKPYHHDIIARTMIGMLSPAAG